MKKRNIKAFTVVELVIVIAVIAVLAAVLIPTFSGIIKQANISADKAELASLNTNLAAAKVDSEIKNINDVYRVIEETYGAETLASFAPRSAKHGYCYWYDSAKNEVVLGTKTQIEAESVTPINNATSNKVTFLGVTELENEQESKSGFQGTSSDAFRKYNDRFYILDKVGLIGEALTALETGASDIPEKLDALNNLPVLTSQDLRDIVDHVLDKVSEVAIINDETIFAPDPDKVTSIYFVDGIKNIPSKSAAWNYIAKADVLSDKVIDLPSTIEAIHEYGLWFGGEAVTVKIQTTLNGIDEIQGVFHAYSTNATILDKHGNEYTISGGTLTGPNGDTRGLEYCNKVTSFVIKPYVGGPNFYYSASDNTIYVAHNAGDFTVGPEDFEASINKDTVVQDVEWSVSAGAPFSIDGGNVSLTNVPDKFESDFVYEGTITATSVTNSEAIATLDVRVVTMKSATLKVGSNQLMLDNTAYNNAFTLTYDGTPETAEYAIDNFVASHNYDVAKCCTSVEPTYTTSGNLFTIAGGKLTLKTGTGNLNGTQTFTVRVGNHIEKTFTVTVFDNSATTFEKVFANTDTYLYRVGNSNTITLGQLFETTKAGNNISVAIYDAAVGEAKTVDELTNNHLTATYTKSGLTADTWAASTIKFGGTGVAIIKITNEAGSQKVIVEVVEGYNITDASQLKSNANNILLNDIKLVGADAKFSLTGDANNHKAIYGNGFKFDITEATTKGNGVITLTNADLDNIQIIGKVYETYQDTEGQGKNEYYASAVLISSGSSKISNSYIFGCRSNIRMSGDLEIVNSVVECARLSNINIIAGTLTIDGLTTINEPNAKNNNVVGLGIMFDTNSADDAKINIKGGLTQHNWVCKDDKSKLPNFTGKDTLIDKIFHNDQSDYHHTIDGVVYANMGIAGLNGNIPTSAVSHNNPYYEAKQLSLLTFTGFVVSLTDAKYNATTADLIYRNQAYAWTPTTQSNTIPTINWNKYSGGTADVTFERGQSFEFDPNVLTATKHGNKIVATVTINGVDYTGKKITFTEDQICTIKYTIKDSYVYDANGNVIGAQSYEYYLVVNVTTTIPEIKAPEFTFTGATGTTTVVVGDKTYVVPTGNTSDTTKFYNIGNGIYAPIVEVAIKDNTSDFTGYYPIFGGVSITWYDEAGNATTYNSSSKLSDIPSGLEWITDITNLKGSKVWNGYKTYSSYGLCREAEADGSTNESDTYKNVEFSFQAEGTEKYYYYIRFKEPAHKKPSGCVTGDTLVTLADGTQKEIQYVTYEDQLLVWNFYTGEYDAVPASIVMNHGYDNYTVVTLNFSDGTTVKTINGHGFFDVAENKYVIIDASNVADYVGHEFVKVNGDGYETVILESFNISEQYTESWSILTAVQYNCILENMWTLTPAEVEGSTEYLMPYEIGDNMKYDEAKMKADIEKYGLYTYEDFADYCTYEQFVALGLANFKVSVGKGYITWGEIEYLISIHIG